MRPARRRGGVSSQTSGARGGAVCARGAPSGARGPTPPEGASGASWPSAEGEPGGGEWSWDAGDAVTFLPVPRRGPAGRGGGGSLDWRRLDLVQRRPESAPLAFFIVGEYKKGFRMSIGATPVNWCVNVCSEQAEPRGSESARVCKELLCVWYFEKMAECLFQSGMPPPRQALVAAAHRNSCYTLGFRAVLGRTSLQTLKFWDY